MNKTSKNNYLLEVYVAHNNDWRKGYLVDYKSAPVLQVTSERG